MPRCFGAGKTGRNLPVRIRKKEMINFWKNMLTNGGIHDNISRQLSDSSTDNKRNARVVELVDSGSSAHSGHAGSSPASRTKKSSFRKKAAFSIMIPLRHFPEQGKRFLLFSVICRNRGFQFSKMEPMFPCFGAGKTGRNLPIKILKKKWKIFEKCVDKWENTW